MIGILRGLVVVLGVAFGPVFAARAAIPLASSLGAGTVANSAFGVMLGWSFLALPVIWMVPGFAPGTALLLSAVEWTLVGLLLGRLTAGRSFGRVLAFAVGAVVIVGPLTQLVIRALGYAVIVEGP